MEAKDRTATAPVAGGALEALLHATGRPLLFLDLSGLPRDHWLRAPLTAGLSFYNPQPARWARCFDGLFFIDIQKPSTLLPEDDLGLGYLGHGMTSSSQMMRSRMPRQAPTGLLHQTLGSERQKILHGSPAR
jgi:hypothetical protein